MPSLHILYASTAGHTEFVVDRVIERLNERNPSLVLSRVRADSATPDDVTKGDVLLLASGTWNTGGIEGQLNPYLHFLLRQKAAGIDLKGKRVAVIALGDRRYRYTAKSRDHLVEFVQTHGGEVLGEPLVIVNEPYGQESAIDAWTDTLSSHL